MNASDEPSTPRESLAMTKPEELDVKLISEESLAEENSAAAQSSATAQGSAEESSATSQATKKTVKKADVDEIEIYDPFGNSSGAMAEAFEKGEATPSWNDFVPLKEEVAPPGTSRKSK